MLFLPQIAGTPNNERRLGAVLLVVITLLALFSAVGLAFVFYAESEATAARGSRQAEYFDRHDVDPELLLSFYLSQLLFDTDNINSALRGHSLGRSMYGYDPNCRNVPFNGVGRLRYTDPSWGGANNYDLVNYQFFPGEPFRDPEYYGNRAIGNPSNRYIGGGNVPWTYADMDNMFVGEIDANGHVLAPAFHRFWQAHKRAAAAAAPYMQKYFVLYPDPSAHPNFPLAEEGLGAPHVRNLDFSAGCVFYDIVNPVRPIGAITGAVGASIVVTSPNHGLATGQPVIISGVTGTTNANGAFTVNVINANQFSWNGAVVNAPYIPGTGIWQPLQRKIYNNDSYWTDPAFPTLTAPDGRRYKPLFAAFIMPLDGKINLNVHGNIRAEPPSTQPYAGTKHASNHGLGPWEINPAHTLSGIVTGASGAGVGPIVVTSGNHRLNTGQRVLISGVTGNTAANGMFTITKVDANNFSLNGTTGNGPYGGGGVWQAAMVVWPNEWVNLNRGSGGIVGRYGPDGQPGVFWDPGPDGRFGTPDDRQTRIPIPGPGPGNPPPWFSLTDLDAVGRDYLLSNRFSMPGELADKFWSFPEYRRTGRVLSTTGAGVSPIIVTSPNHRLSTGVIVTIAGVSANANANGTFSITTIDNNRFALNGTTGNGPYVGGGTWVAITGPGGMPPVATDYDSGATDVSPNPPAPPPPQPRVPPLRKERLFHPLLFNPFNPNARPQAQPFGSPDPANPTMAADDRLFPLSHLEALLRYGSTNSPALTSDVLRLAPLSLVSRRARGLVTLHSMDLGLPGAAPWLHSAPNSPLQWPFPATTAPPNATETAHPAGAIAVDFPSALLPTGTSPGGDFNADWRFAMGNLVNRLLVNRNLGDLPGGLSARKNLARDIYKGLVKVTGATDPDLNPAPVPLAQYNAARWLAQLAVNIVDYVDNDDSHTPFEWNRIGVPVPLPGGGVATDIVPRDWVFGTELPRLVINEVYVQLDNNPDDLAGTPPMATKHHINFWVELHNPFNTTPTNPATSQPYRYPSEGGQAKLKIADNPPIYQLVLRTEQDPDLRAPDNARGEFRPMPGFNAPQAVDLGASPQRVVLPADGIYQNTDNLNKNVGFLVAGPEFNFLPGTDPNLNNVTTFKTPQMSIRRDGGNPATPVQPTVLLQRLANPDLPPDTNTTITVPRQGGGPPAVVANPSYNPYITIDYAENVPVHDTRKFDAAGPKTPVLPPTDGKSWGRRQPYAAQHHPATAGLPVEWDPLLQRSQWMRQDPLPPPGGGQPKHTFLRHNAIEANASSTPPIKPDPNPPGPRPQTLKIPFDWLVHLDRHVTSPMELLHVSSFRPHELTQQFMVRGQRFQHKAPWFDEAARIYRLFEFLEAGHRFAGQTVAGRAPGNINLNNVWDVEILRALADHNGISNYPSNATNDELLRIFSKMIDSRSKFIDPAMPVRVPGPEDRPFKSLATGFVASGSAQYPGGIGIHDTLLRADPDPADPTPMTSPTRRRLFEVTPQLNYLPAGLTNPFTSDHPSLRYELLNKIFNNVTTRSNVFAVWVTVGFFEVGPETFSSGPANAGAAQITVADATGFKAGERIVVDGGANFEIVQVAAINGNQLSLAAPGLTKPHAAGFLVRVGLRGELNRADGRHIRHRMFAVVDRTNMVSAFQVNQPLIDGITAGAPEATVRIASVRSAQQASPSGVSLGLRRDMVVSISGTGFPEAARIIEISDSSSPPVIRVQPVSGKPFARAHPPGSRVTFNVFTGQGNPGPQPTFDHRNSNVVLHYSIIE